MPVDALSFADRLRTADILDPKRDPSARRGRASLYSYYAGFSPAFARGVLASLGLSPEHTVVDPWNGSGTTTTAAREVGSRARGYDLNPVMVVAARAASLSPGEGPSIRPITRDIMASVSSISASLSSRSDPLCRWIAPSSAEYIRRVEKRIQILLVDAGRYLPVVRRGNLDCLSEIASFFYVALFRTVRTLVGRFYSSNPTWIRSPGSPSRRIRPHLETVLAVFSNEVQSMADLLAADDHRWCVRAPEVQLAVASSDALPLAGESIDVALSSPPYCTRIDYAVATMAELALLGYGWDTDFLALRRGLIGTPTVQGVTPAPSSYWGQTCARFLDQVASHASKASSTYYYRNHVQYFDQVYRSLAEIRRVLAPGGACVLVVQDSYYKDVHNDLPTIFAEMGAACGLGLVRRVDFGHARTMAVINPQARRYRTCCSAVESVLCFTRDG